MPNNKMLIDASHPEETRVVVVRGNRIEEFDFESQDKKQLRGNIYLARVTRVEPSLQAAFVEYGGNRHGFLAFSEIHPDYYQIPMADRQALLRADAKAAEEEEADEEGRGDRTRRRSRGGRNRDRNGGEPRHKSSLDEDAPGEGAADRAAEAPDGEPAEPAFRSGEAYRDDTADAPADGDAEDRDLGSAGDNRTGTEAAAAPDRSIGDAPVEAPHSNADEFKTTHAAEVVGGDVAAEPGRTPIEADASERDDGEGDAGEKNVADHSGSHEDRGGSGSMAAAVEADVVSEPVEDGAAETGRGVVEEVPATSAEEGEVESVGAEDPLDEVRNRRKPPRRHYKIQEVIKRRQILLVQVVKEERGNKGAALTTYLSLAGRYSVLMPNTARGGGISRKITSAQDRKRLKEVMQDLEVPEGMGVILRTAGENRTKAEIKRDYEYLMRLWENVRSLTLQSTAPALVYEEGSLIKRSVRDLYNKDIEEILVAGEDGYREAKDFMRMLMPSHAKMVQPYRDSTPILARNGIEAQLDKMLLPQVTLKSGGYIIINQTEALVAIDVNSGRSTREHSIEDTALQTNLEAAEEVARQLRLRDLAGLIVIDFIDMEENRNNRSVEKRLKDHLKNDRARIQVGRISHFGLLEMSRQRIRASVLDSTMKPCPHCGGTGHVRSDSSVALLVVRAIEEFLLKDSRSHITVKTPNATAMYLLNHKRSTLVELERRFGVTITMEADDTVGAQHYVVVRGAVAEKPIGFVEAQMLATYDEPEEPEEDVVGTEDEDEGNSIEASESDAENQSPSPDSERDRKRRRRRRRRGGREHDQDGPIAGHHGGGRLVEADGATEDADDEGEDEAGVAAEAEDGSEGERSGHEPHEADRKRRRRGKRGGRRSRADDEGIAASFETSQGASSDKSYGQRAEGEPDLGEPDVEDTAGGDTAGDDMPGGQNAVSGQEGSERVEVEPLAVSAAAAATGSSPAASDADNTAADPIDAASDPVPPTEAGAPAKRPARRSRAKKPAAEAGLDGSGPGRLNGAAERGETSEAMPTLVDGAALDGIAIAPAPEAAAADGAVDGSPALSSPRQADRPSEPVVSSTAADPSAGEDKPKRGGWWQRRSFF